jgi:hypothetical protein
MLRSVAHRVRRSILIRRFPGSAEYWERRYSTGGNSGAGSYGTTAEFKAEVLNSFVANHQVSTVVEFGCGDGHQLSLSEYPSYVGVDVSKKAIAICQSRFHGDSTKRFVTSSDSSGIHADLALSLDVILHLVEDEVFDAYMRSLFTAADKYVVVFSSNLDERPSAHVRHRLFLDWVAGNQPSFDLISTVNNPRVVDEDSDADFYFFSRRR